MISHLAPVLDLVLPSTCVGCRDGPGPVLCRRCRMTLAGPPVPVRPDPAPAGLPPCWAVGKYDGAVRTALISFKDRGRRGLAGPLSEALALAVAGAAAGAPAVGLVPVPSSRRAARARGGDHMRRLAGLAARALTSAGLPATVLGLLAPVGRQRDSAGLSAGQRAVNVAGAFVVRAGSPGRGPLVLVDDVVTTGATLAEATAALSAAGVEVAAAAVVAATVRRSACAFRP
jgi:predicted amidophosphoribosyltransferase